jgi:tRNA U34 2-thiouridine synthase MnmA/TrmU
MSKAIALFSGGLDSMLAAKLVASQNIDVVCINFTSPFFDSKKAESSAKNINLPLIIDDITHDYLKMLHSPRYGFGKNMNPCIDCHTLMLKITGQKMESLGADFIITGEVLGQRPMSQTKQSLNMIAKNSGYADYILRPLSAQLLAPIKAEMEGKIDRSMLLAISGRGRKDQLRLAKAFGITNYPPPAGGCLLTDPMFTRRLLELFAHTQNPEIRDYHLLKYGRHFRTQDDVKIIVGRNNKDNEELKKLAEIKDLSCNMADFPGPYVLVPEGNASAQHIACALCARYSDAPDNTEATVICQQNGKLSKIKSIALPKEECELLMI